ncbi:hypothetical protein GGI25_004525 [Coemansia spiralis]|uniref:Metallo-beta-lactamase domain-containing protein n=2 Tax=Coemansia TaxID=4863 RepID=A0A9W8G407_9FUNG|nr:beta-lactamase-like protein [Coemansia spiralis]KAJ1990170.1 hypothetical protein EDC05_004226 [Coemansia umbellata]KAJ2620695.1 hypothetical protein GGI26_004773 [Coemansia sp. RSA 1358]KAJ2673958.1 hypothetical protein GGI25_004525 [Coemansia spiralis]
MAPTGLIFTPKARVREIIFLGTGTSGYVPNVTCIADKSSKCKVCKSSITPEGRKNKRRNTSLLVRIDHPDGRERNVVIDCGKSFYESALDVFIEHGIENIDAVLITHGHADAIFGLDDLRQWTMHFGTSIPVYADQESFDTIAQAFPYIVDRTKATGSGAVAALEFHIIEDPYTAFDCQGVMFQPLRVEHGMYIDGSPFYFIGFRFDDIAYVSDCSKIPEKTAELMAGCKLLILDALRWTPHPSHFSYQQALDEVRRLKPERTLFTDFCHDMEHSVLEEQAAKIKAEENIIVEPSYDGQRVTF